MLYADIIVNISHENLDKTYQYAIPQHLKQQAVIGTLVNISFGRGSRIIQGYIVALSHIPKLDIQQIKSIDSIVQNAVVIESQLIQLAYWMKQNYGSTMNAALRTVIPIKKTIRSKEKKYIKLLLTEEETEEQLAICRKKNYKAKERLLYALQKESSLDYNMAIHCFNIANSTLKAMKNQNIIQIQSERIYRNPVEAKEGSQYKIRLNKIQQAIADDFKLEYRAGIRNVYLIHGVTGSGKTEVYMEMIEEVLQRGKQVIVLIPEISLTYQTVMRFYTKFGNKISILNSRLSQGEKYDQYERAKNGEVDIMIGPRSALFTPFKQLGLIVIDEEQEGTYKSEMPPKYHAREAAIERARISNASVVLGSATPSLEAYYKAQLKQYKLYEIQNRANQSVLPTVWIEDLREELKRKNYSIFSNHLKMLILDRLEKKEQIMLFLNRRGYAGFVSCRSCGHVMKCPHCDISLTSHQPTSSRTENKLICHYCSHEEIMPTICPVCSSPYIAAFGTGTQKVEQFVKKEFPTARVLRMDMDTTKEKDGHEKILELFANQKADILIGTQMIVKGHDFKQVTLVGILAADLSLYASDYRAAEKTFELLVQAAGRAGRGENRGEVVIQTYHPDHYSIVMAANNDYKGFYKQEMLVRNLADYPPIASIMVILLTSKEENRVEIGMDLISNILQENIKKDQLESIVSLIGPSKAYLSKANDYYRRVIYIKSKAAESLKWLKDKIEEDNRIETLSDCTLQFDFNPMNTY